MSDHGDEAGPSSQSLSRPQSKASPRPNVAEAELAAAAAAAASSSSPPPPPAPPPSFDPVFTLLTNTTSNTTIHPRVHYIFTDDDPAAILASTVPSDHDDSKNADNDRALIVDLARADTTGSGWTVSWASSLSPDFAVTGSSLSVQHADAADAPGDSSLMLRVEGVEREALSASDSLPSSGSGPIGRDTVDGLLDDFKRRMGVLKKVVGEGERRREVLLEQQRKAEAEGRAHQAVDREEEDEDDDEDEDEDEEEEDETEGQKRQSDDQQQSSKVSEKKPATG